MQLSERYSLGLVASAVALYGGRRPLFNATWGAGVRWSYYFSRDGKMRSAFHQVTTKITSAMYHLANCRDSAYTVDVIFCQRRLYAVHGDALSFTGNVMEFPPVVYEHAAMFIGRRPWEVSRSADLLVEAHAAAYAAYRHTPVVAGIDVYNVEAEAYGAEVGVPLGNEVPSVTGQLCQHAEDICRLAWPDAASDGRFPIVMEAAARLKEACLGAEIRIPLSGPFSIACALVGFQEILTELL